MANNSTEDSSDVTTQEANTSLCQLAILLLGFAHGAVDDLDRLLKGGKLGHGIRDLSGPQRVQSFIQTTKALLGDDFAPALAHSGSVWRQGGLHADLDSLHGTQGHISKELRRGTSTEEDQGAIGLWEQLVSVQVLEVLVQTVLSGTLEGVA